MSQATEQIARQFANGSVNRIIWGDIIYNVKVYGLKGDGVVSDANALNQLILAASVKGGLLIFSPGTYRLSTNVTVPTNVTLWFMMGAKVSMDTGITLTINGPIESGPHQIFSGNGTVIGAPRVDRFYPQWWGAKGDGVNDDTISIQKAIDAAGINGGIVFLLAGTYLVTSTLTINRANVGIVGVGDASLIQSNFAAGNVIYAGRSDLGAPAVENVFLRNFSMNSTVVKTSGAAIFCEHAERYEFINVRLCPQEIGNYNFYDGMYFKYFDNVLISRCNIQCSHYGVAMYGKTNQSWGANLFIGDGSKINTDQIIGTGVFIGGSCGGVSIESTDIIGCNMGIRMDDILSGAGNREIFLNAGLYVDSSGNHGISIGQNSIGLMHCNNIWVASSGQNSNGGFPNGSNIDIGSQNSGSVIIDGCRIFNALGSGVVANGGNITVTDCFIHNNGQGTSGGHGVNIENASVASAIISNNNIYSNGKAVLGIGIRVTANANNYVITGNIVRNNGSAQIVDNGSTNKVVANNLTA